MQRSTKIVLLVSAVLSLSEAGLVWANRQAALRRVEQVVHERGDTLREGFLIAKATTEMQLSAIANFIAGVEDVKRHLDSGQTARQRQDATAAEAIRQQLQGIVGRRWHDLQFRFLLRQLAFYFPDGTAFLRSDQPYRHGDNATGHSAMLREVSAQSHVVSGFEIGRWSTGLSAISPIFDSGDDRRMVGMVELGTSFDPMLVPICPTAECGLAILLERGAIASLSTQVRDTQFSPDRVAGPWVMEASSNPALTRRFLPNLPQRISTDTETRLIRVEGGRWFGLTTFPLDGFSPSTGDRTPPAGMVAAWQDASDLMGAAQQDVKESILMAVAGFLAVLVLLITSVRLATRRLETEIAEATAESRSLLDQVSAMAERDPLTGLYNRRSFDTRMAEACAAAERDGVPLSLAIIDLDHFKSINDTYGHCAGDNVIALIAALLHDMARATDVVCRWGGEEFVLALPTTADRQALVMLERLRSCLAEHNATAAEGSTPPFTFSAGICQRQAGDSLDTLLKRADRALYRAKEQGRDRIEIAASDQIMV